MTGMSPSRYRAQALSRGGPAPIPGCFVLMRQTGLPAREAVPGARGAREDSTS
jgi:hypothetical protein